MTPAHDPALPRQLPLIAKIIQDETWLEGERRRSPVPPSDPIVRANVCEVVIKNGAKIRAAVTAGGESRT